DAWKWMLTSSAIPAFIILIIRMGTPESPRWLVSKGRHEEALQIVQKYIGPNIILDDEVAHAKKSSFASLFHKDMIKRTAFNCIFFVCLVMPYFAIYTFLPIILDEIGLRAGHTTDFLLNGLLIIGALLGIWFTIKYSRRGFLISSFIILVISLGLLSVLPSNLTVLMIIAFSVFTLILS
ncbi:MFS transporter, partial [Bacillus sp. MHSD17]|nr:MFS transporter [Bacillus sp. MHSD17]